MFDGEITMSKQEGFEKDCIASASSTTFAFLFVLASLALHIYYASYAEDDAYIHMRIAMNFFLHGEPFYNLGDPVMASTAPLWILLLTPLSILGAQMPLGIALLNGLILCLVTRTWCFVARIFLGVDGPRALLLTGLGIWGSTVTCSLSLMETPLALLLVGLSLISLQQHRPIWILTATFSLFVRPECIVFLLCFVLWRIIQRRSIEKYEVAFAAIGLGPLAAFQLFFFHGIIPHTAIAKGIVYKLSTSEWLRFLLYASYGEHLTLRLLPWIIVGLIPCSLVIIYRGSLSERRIRRHLIDGIFDTGFYLIFPSILIIAAYGIEHTLVFPWYSPLFNVPIAVVASHIILERSGAARIFAALLQLPFYVIVVVTLLGLFDVSLSPLFDSGARVRQYKEIGTALINQYPNARLLAAEIGGIGYTFDGKIVDGVGLVSPRALAFHPLRVPDQRAAGFLGAIPTAYIAEANPELIVAFESFLQIDSRSTALVNYREYSVSPVLPEDAGKSGVTKVWGNGTLGIFIRKDLPLPKNGWKIANTDHENVQ